MGAPHEGSIRRPIASWANALTSELHLAPFLRKITLNSVNQATYSFGQLKSQDGHKPMFVCFVLFVFVCVFPLYFVFIGWRVCVCVCVCVWLLFVFWVGYIFLFFVFVGFFGVFCVVLWCFVWGFFVLLFSELLFLFLFSFLWVVLFVCFLWIFCGVFFFFFLFGNGYCFILIKTI